MTALVLLYGVVPILLKLIALLLMRGYPITAAEHDRIRQTLALRSAS